MTTTLFLVQVWGPVLLAVGIGMLASRSYYMRVYKDVATEPLAALAFGVIAMVVGLVQIHFHNVWDGLLTSLISLLGWGTFIKGVMFLVAPEYVSKTARAWGRVKLIPAMAGIVLIVGAYLTWVGYMG